MPTAVAAARQSYADHPMVRLETAPPGPCHAVSLQETLSGTFTACATVILRGGSTTQGETEPTSLVSITPVSVKKASFRFFLFSSPISIHPPH